MKIAIAVISLWMSISASAQPAPTRIPLQIRTNLVNDNIVGFGSDGRFYFITCNYPAIPVIHTKSTAVMYLQNEDGDILAADHFKTNRHMPRKKSEGILLGDSARTQVCNRPNGEYNLEIVKQGDITTVEYVSGRTYDARVTHKNRQY